MQSRDAMVTGLSRLLLAGLVALAAAPFSQPAFADEPVIGGGLSAAVPVSKFKTPASLGGGIDVYGGYRWDVTEHIGLSLLAGPDFNFFQNDTNSSAESIIIADLMAGPRLSIGEGPYEVFADGRAGWAVDLAGPINDDGVAFTLGGGFAYELARGTSLTLFGRYNESEMRARPGSNNSNLRWVNAGIGIQHRFLGPEPMERVAPPPPTTTAPAVKRRLVLRGVNFDFDKSNIRPDARPVLDEAARTLQEYGDVRIAVGGHTDSRGTDQYNQGLSVRRAQAVADYLAARGVARNRMQIDGYGESRPVATNDTDDGRAQNRRVELTVLP
jgi:outer membrane protein OmpA-like peptidoglycan-associated protein